MQTESPQNPRYDRRRNRGYEAGQGDDVDLDQRESAPRRRSYRLPLRLWTEGRRDEHLDFHNCSNLSEDGMFIESPAPYPLGALVMIEFNLPGVPEPLAVHGRVVSVLDEDTAGENIMGNGFAFEHVAAADRALIRVYVDAARTRD